jgi:soluble lytic murein transglycosylase
MFTALGSPKGALLGLSAAALILAISYSISAAPMGGIDVVRVAPQPRALPPIVASAGDVIELANANADQLATGAIAAAPEPDPAQPMPAQLGSAGFVEALGLIEDKDYAGAFEAARALTKPVERRTVEWASIYYGGGAIAPQQMKAFEAEAPDYVDDRVFKTRLEQALIKAKASSAQIIKYLGGAMPNTIDAQIKLAAAYVADGQTKRGAAIARAIWVEQFLDKATEARMLANFGDMLTADDHWTRAMHLMMHDRATATERLFKFLTPAQKSLAVARNAVSRNAKNAKALLDAVDPAYKSNPIYYFSRAQRARQFELWDDAIAYLNKGKATDPDSAEWWYERRTLTRQLLSLGDPKRAYQAAAGYSDGPEGRVVEARFHSGWIALSFLDDPASAATHFARMAEFSTLPDSVTQANYWLGRALAKAGKVEEAKAAFAIAANYPTVYYGLLARQELGLKPVELRSMPAWQDSEAAFDQNEAVQAVRLLAANGEQEKASALLRTLANRLETGGEFVLAARLAQSIDAHNLAIAIADIADKRGMPLDLFSFPKDGIPATRVAALDAAAIYAVARQESRFQVNAVSSAGARGLMQLMPGTAKETAGKLGLSYSANRLTTDPLYNTRLGAFYLDNQLERYDGSLLLAAAAYNAGPGNANKWIAAFGDPRSSKVDPVVWVELIPFQETRNYVKRVFGNYIVYRARLGYDDRDVSKVMHSIKG